MTPSNVTRDEFRHLATRIDGLEHEVEKLATHQMLERMRRIVGEVVRDVFREERERKR